MTQSTGIGGYVLPALALELLDECYETGSVSKRSLKIRKPDYAPKATEHPRLVKEMDPENRLGGIVALSAWSRRRRAHGSICPPYAT